MYVPHLLSQYIQNTQYLIWRRVDQDEHFESLLENTAKSEKYREKQMKQIIFDTPIDRHNVDFIHRLFDTEAIENCSPKLCDIFWVIMSLVIALLLGVCACSALRLLDIISDCIDECRLVSVSIYLIIVCNTDSTSKLLSN